MGEAQVVLVTGAGGLIGHRLVKDIKGRGCRVREVDLKPPALEPTDADEFHILEFHILDFRRWPDCLRATRDVTERYHLAANMGGIGFISRYEVRETHDNAIINTHMLEAARLNGVERYLFTSSARVYAGYRQDSPDVTLLGGGRRLSGRS